MAVSSVHSPAFRRNGPPPTISRSGAYAVAALRLGVQLHDGRREGTSRGSEKSEMSFLGELFGPRTLDQRLAKLRLRKFWIRCCAQMADDVPHAELSSGIKTGARLVRHAR